MLATIISLIATVGFEFLSVDPVAQRTGMGYALHGDGYDVHYNPGGLAFSDNTHYSISYLNYFDGTHFGYLGYERSQLGVGLRYFYSGSMKKVDELEQEYGTFGVYHIDINVGKGFVYKSFGLGVSIKGAYASIDTLNAIGIGADIGAMYRIPEPDIHVGLSVKNIGYGVKPFIESRETFPYEITLSAAKIMDVGWFGLDLVKPALLGFGVRFGGAYYVNPILHLKASYSTLLSAIRTEGLGFLAGLTVGLGVRKDRLLVNYSYSPYFDLGGGHRISISFGG
ncbi:hypothetical protein AMJ83_05155 [candidate division WOR_3 bacterium SM23_42]|uniref:DUF5723 domain-containing protein n=1 Tax=candidate division WOR_3 bacterium SM23_42 TaxID=1703779 RepID=A0A0S8FST3_UNCW3|nr:MAG: hypothetical protein AMJ83_05155 [candidate division WOR_3 bacterium SM23_42]